MNDAPAPGSLPGYDVPAVEAYVAEVTDLAPPLTWTKLEGGHSNLTYLLEDGGGRRAVVRRPPLGELLPKAHDMGREHRVMAALADTGVPVPRMYGYCPDPDLTGAHFYVMSQVQGKALYTIDDALSWLDEDGRRRLGPSFVEVQAALHSVEPAAVGLDDLGRHEGYVARQLKTWYGSWTASAEAAEYDDERIHRLHDLLLGSMPDQGPARVVHGDYGLHNCLASPEGTVSAVLDWEIATLGDPLADFAYAMQTWVRPSDVPVVRPDAATMASGFAERDDLIALYGRLTGRDVSGLDYYLAFNYFKTACILHGVYARYRRGQKSTEGIDLVAMRERLGLTIDKADATAAALRG